MKKIVLAFVFAFLLPVFSVASAAEPPFNPRLAEDGSGALFGGYQVESGDDAQFELFAIQSWHRRPGGLGRYNGRLADVALDPAGRPLALTRDGALNAYGDEPETLANPADRWNMLALAWTANGPEALSVDGGGLWIVRPGAGGDWLRDDLPVASDAGRSVGAQLLVMGGDLHLFWGARSPDMSEGAIRHAVRRGGVWEELDSLPFGDVTAFSVFRRDGMLEIVAIVPDPLAAGPSRVVGRVFSDGVWSAAAAVPDRLADRLAGAFDFALTRGHLLTAGLTGAALSSNGARTETFPLLEVVPETFAYSAWGSLFLLVAFAALLFLYCRRSRNLSRRFPGRPPDLVSRAAALAVDWMLVSIAMSAYHTANGDVVIFQDLLSIGAVNDIFWINLGALALFMAVMEGIYGYTPGKKLAGMRVRGVLGGKPGFLQAVFRNALRCADMFPIGIGVPGLVGLVVAMLNPRRLRLGDMLAATIVRRHLPLSERRILLASASPRRLELIRALGLDPEVRPSGVVESVRAGEAPRDAVLRLARDKAVGASEEAGEKMAIVVAADTMVVLDGGIFGKPADAAEAASMLRRLSGRSHTVFTGVAVLDGATGQLLADVEQTEVEFRDLSSSEIDSYVAGGDPFDKAGAYGVQSGFFVRQVRGSLSNVAGLPMEKLQGMLEALDG